jgi:hypothetical protein
LRYARLAVLCASTLNGSAIMETIAAKQTKDKRLFIILFLFATAIEMCNATVAEFFPNPHICIYLYGLP